MKFVLVGESEYQLVELFFIEIGILKDQIIDWLVNTFPASVKCSEFKCGEKVLSRP